MQDDVSHFSHLDINQQLDRIFKSDAFDASKRNQSFLRYIVEKTLEGNKRRIKSFAIAVDVFGRGDDFDPKTDSVVRVEARRLRRALEHYYLTDGAMDPIRISIPKGAYRPVFNSRYDPAIKDGGSPQISDERLVGRPQRIPVILVQLFTMEGLSTGFSNFTLSFTRQLIVGLTRFIDISVLGMETSLLASRRHESGQKQADVEHDFLLSGVTVVSGTSLEIEAHLTDVRSKQCVWAQTYSRLALASEIMQVRDEVANQVVRELAQLYGVIFTRTHEMDGAPPEHFTSYECVGQFYRYWQTYDVELFEQVRQCLEIAIVRDPRYAEAYACLSQIYSNAFRFGHDVSDVTDDPRERALELANASIEFAPRSSRGFHALGLAYWFNGDVEGSLETFEAGLKLNPNDTEIMASLGHHSGLLARWDQAIPLLEESFARNPAQPKNYRISLSIFHYVHGRYQQAITEAKRTNAPNVVYGHLMVAVSAAKLGNVDETRKALSRLLEIDPRFRQRVLSDLAVRNLSPTLRQMLAKGLEDAFSLCSERALRS